MRRLLQIFVLVLVAVGVMTSCVSAETLHLKHEFLPAYSQGNEKHIGELIRNAQADNKLRLIIATEKDIIKKIEKEQTDNPNGQSAAAQDVEYKIEETPMLFILHGMSGNGADDIRGMKISKAAFKKQFTYVDPMSEKDPGVIEIEVEKPQTTWMPFGSGMGTDDVRYINARVFFEGLAPGTYLIECTLKTTHIEASGMSRNEGVDKITKIETKPLANFRLRLN
ncbi:MAG: hypothetical protein CVV42_09085 [Candidatus Riflebacteria bacterium HGW-Riflebacteria-2]|jgi:DNA gyrase/topoisomerase IV subunit A|nr:MAG: hypothetical protein CVV42_09085 [Candidatus Riflebacteria bacterium HGW-Riflebacteria-2]